jgi:hypothetical protein
VSPVACCLARLLARLAALQAFDLTLRKRRIDRERSVVELPGRPEDGCQALEIVGRQAIGGRFGSTLARIGGILGIRHAGSKA